MAVGYDVDPEVLCPYCGQIVPLELAPETKGTFVQDCDACCRPWQVAVTREEDGTPVVAVTRS